MLLRRGIKHLYTASFSLSFSSLNVPCAAQYQAMQGDGGLMGQQHLPGSQSDATPSITPSFKRIRVANDKDIDKTYPLLASYIKQPELAFTVDDFVADERDAAGWGGCSMWGGNEIDPRFKRPAIAVQDDAHSTIETYVQGLQLGDDITLSMIKALDWKKSQIRGEVPDSPKGFDGHNWDYASTAMVILMSLCKNVTNLYLGNVGPSTVLSHYLLKSNYGLIPVPGLQRVKRLEILPSDHTWEDRVYQSVELLDYFRYFHRLPMLEDVIMDGIAEYQANRESFPPGTSNLKKIRIEHTDMSSGMLATILRIPRRLEELRVQEGGLWSVDGGSPQIVPKTLSKALLDHKETLRVLDLDLGRGMVTTVYGERRGMGYEPPDGMEEFEADYGESWEEYYAYEQDEYFDLDLAQADSSRPLLADLVPSTRTYGYTIGSLHDFTALTHLSLNFRFLFGPGKDHERPHHLAEAPPTKLIDALPPTLEYLCLYNYVRGENVDIDELVDELVNNMAIRLPRLQTVRGVTETVWSEGSKYDEHDSEEELWQRPKLDLGWVLA